MDSHEPHKHEPRQHRDGKEPWCPACGLNAQHKVPRSSAALTLDQFNKPPVPAIMKYFAHAHLPHHLAAISRPFCELAWQMCDALPPGDEKDFCLRLLLLAKDAAVRTEV